MTKNRNIITYTIIGILVLVGVVWVYWMITKSNDEELEGGVAVATGDEVLTTETNSRAQQLVLALKNIEKIDLSNQTILSNAAFKRLEDYGREIGDRPVGRSNPFAPFGIGNQTSFDIMTSTTTDDEAETETLAPTTTDEELQ